jgi:1-acyl-sn-glycerol-3-phosphate acyltransferase
MAAVRQPVSPTYRVAMRVCTPVVRWWGRLEVEGLEHLPESGPTLLAVNHDSHWDPVAVGVAGLSRRQVRALAKAELWKNPALGKVLDGMGQIKILRGGGSGGAMADARRELAAGACIGIFPEGTLSYGHRLRARSGLGRLAGDVPEARVVCCTVIGTGTIARFPKRPRIHVAFFPPAGGGLRPGEDPAAFVARLMDEIRERAPWVAAGRDPEAKHEAVRAKLEDRGLL